MKMFALGVNNYIHDNFNLFDAVVVSLSLIDWSLDLILTPAQKASVGSSMQALRALRLLRVVKLARSWHAFLFCCCLPCGCRKRRGMATSRRDTGR